jgi:enoyl-CoA hydratase/carnithine racemase
MADGMTDAAPLLRADAGGIARLTLNRPAARNGLSLALMQDLLAALEAIAGDRSVRLVLLEGHGPAFCAGHDLREITAHFADADGGRAFFEQAMTTCARLMQAITGLPQPVIAIVEGVATAAGCQLVATADLAIAGAAARFCTPGVDIGLFCSTPAVALSRAVARKPAMEMLLTGAMIGAAEAQRIGLVNRVVPEGEAGMAAAALADRIASRSAHAVALGKRSFHAQAGQGLAEAYRIAAATMVENLLAEDAAEGIGAFLDKRTPHWRDR